MSEVGERSASSRDDGQVQRAITGHVIEATIEHYSHVAMGEKKEALGRVFRLVASTPASAPSEPGGGSGDPSGDPAAEKQEAG